MKLRLRLVPLLLALAAAFLLAGCVNVAGAGFGTSLVVFLVALMGLGVAACSDDTRTNNGWQVEENNDNNDNNNRDGTWQTCCINGQVDSCFCEANASCNYGWYTDCGDGTCVSNFGDPEDAVCPGDAGDAGDVTDTTDASDASDTTDTADTADAADAADTADTADARDGTWQSCCNDGQVDTCFCPSGVACNYGWYTDCGDGTCVLGGGGQDQCFADAGM